MTTLGEPEVAVRPGGEPVDLGREAPELGDGARRSNAADGAGKMAIQAQCVARRPATAVLHRARASIVSRATAGPVVMPLPRMPVTMCIVVDGRAVKLPVPGHVV